MGVQILGTYLHHSCKAFTGFLKVSWILVPSCEHDKFIYRFFGEVVFLVYLGELLLDRDIGGQGIDLFKKVNRLFRLFPFNGKIGNDVEVIKRYLDCFLLKIDVHNLFTRLDVVLIQGKNGLEVFKAQGNLVSFLIQSGNGHENGDSILNLLLPQIEWGETL